MRVSTPSASAMAKPSKRSTAPHDCMALLVSLLPDGNMEKEVVASVVEGLCAGAGFPEDREKLKAIFRCSSLQMVSFTITEKGYTLTDLDGKFFPAVGADFRHGPAD